MEQSTARQGSTQGNLFPRRRLPDVYTNPVRLDEDVQGMSDHRLHACIALLGKVRRWSTEQLMGLVGEVARRRLYERQGASSLREYLQRLTGLESGQIQLALRLRGALQGLPRLRWVFEHGLTTPHKVRVVLAVATPENERICADVVVKLSKSELEAWSRGYRNRLAGEGKGDSSSGASSQGSATAESGRATPASTGGVPVSAPSPRSVPETPGAVAVPVAGVTAGTVVDSGTPTDLPAAAGPTTPGSPRRETSGCCDPATLWTQTSSGPVTEGPRPEPTVPEQWGCLGLETGHSSGGRAGSEEDGTIAAEGPLLVVGELPPAASVAPAGDGSSDRPGDAPRAKACEATASDQEGAAGSEGTAHRLCEGCHRVGVRLLVNGRPGTWYPDDPWESPKGDGLTAIAGVPGRIDPTPGVTPADVPGRREGTPDLGHEPAAPSGGAAGPEATAPSTAGAGAAGIGESVDELPDDLAAIQLWLLDRGAPTRHLPARVERFVRGRAREACEVPGCRQGGRIVHHGRPFGSHHTHDPACLFLLCRPHAGLADRGLLAAGGPGGRTLEVLLSPPEIDSPDHAAIRRLQRRYEEERSRASQGELGGGDAPSRSSEPSPVPDRTSPDRIPIAPPG